MTLRKQLLVVSVLFLTLLMLSCNTNTFYNESFQLPEKGWIADNAVGFTVDIPDSLTTYSFSINVRNTTKYRFSNLYVFLITEYPNGNMSRDTLEMVLADISGQWLGKGWGETKENDIILQNNLRFPVSGQYKFFIQQAMRTDTLIGISDVGIKITEVQ